MRLYSRLDARAALRLAQHPLLWPVRLQQADPARLLAALSPGNAPRPQFLPWTGDL
jgi:hypothetical protein